MLLGGDYIRCDGFTIAIGVASFDKEDMLTGPLATSPYHATYRPVDYVIVRVHGATLVVTYLDIACNVYAYYRVGIDLIR